MCEGPPLSAGPEQMAERPGQKTRVCHEAFAAILCSMAILEPRLYAPCLSPSLTSHGVPTRVCHCHCHVESSSSPSTPSPEPSTPRPDIDSSSPSRKLSAEALSRLFNSHLAACRSWPSCHTSPASAYACPSPGALYGGLLANVAERKQMVPSYDGFAVSIRAMRLFWQRRSPKASFTSAARPWCGFSVVGCLKGRQSPGSRAISFDETSRHQRALS